MDHLEDRCLLTGLAGGDSFEYQQAPGQRIRVDLSGDIMVEFVGAVVDDRNNTILTDLPGQYFTSASGRAGMRPLGGIGGRDGVIPVTLSNAGAPTFIVDANYGPGNIPVTAQTQDRINLGNLASNRSGKSYSLNVGEVPIGNNATRQIVQLVQLDTDPLNPTGAGTVRSMIHAATLNEDRIETAPGVLFGVGLANVGDVAIDPTTGLMYAINEENGQSVLYAIDPNDPDPLTAVRLIGQIRNESTGGVLSDVQAMAFDNNGQLYIVTRDYDGDPATDASGLPVDTANPPATSPWDVALIPIGKNNPIFNNAVVQRITSGNPALEVTGSFTALTYDARNNQFYAAAEIDTGGTGGTGGGTGQATTSWQLFRFRANPLTVIGPTNIVAANLGDISVGGTGGTGGTGGGGTGGTGGGTRIDGLAFAVDIDDNRILVGLDNGQATQAGAPLPRLLQINTADPANSTAMNEPGSTAFARGLASYTLPTDTRPLLYTISGDNIVRGSSVSLYVDADGVSQVNAIRGAEFNPLDDLLYFVVDEALPDQGQNQGGDRNVMHRIDVNAPNRSAIQNSLRREFEGQVGYSDHQINSFVFDQTAPNAATIYFFDASNGHITRMLITRGAQGVNIRGMNLITAEDMNAVTLNGNPIDAEAISGLAIFDPETNRGDDPATASEFVYGVEDAGANSRLLRIRVPQWDAKAGNWGPATSMVWGALPDPDDTKAPIRGEDLQGLTWNPIIINPFTLEPGALLATDVTTDDLVFVDCRLRPEAVNVFEIYIAQADENAVISMAQVPETGQTRPMQPFTGSVGDIRILTAGSTQAQPAFAIVTPDDNTGIVYIGARTQDLDGQDNDDNLRPVIQSTGLRTTAFGMRPVGDGIVRAGLTVPTNILRPTGTVAADPYDATITPISFSDLTLGMNLDRIGAMSVANDGTIALADNDRTSDAGQRTGAELALVLPNTTQAASLVGITVLVPNPQNPGQTIAVPVPRIIALDWADPDGDTVASLYAVAILESVDPVTGVITSTPTLGTIYADPASTVETFGQFNPIGPVGGVGGPIAGVQGMAFSPNGLLYVLDDTSMLYVLEPMTGAVVTGVNPVQVRDATGALQISSMDFDGAGMLFAHDVVNGRLVEINLVTGMAGVLLNNPAGSLRTSVGAISYDPLNVNFVAVDNALSWQDLGIGEAGAQESAMLLRLRGLAAADAKAQDIGRVLIGGALSGRVNISGSSNLFYTGWLLTGQTAGALRSTTLPGMSNIPVDPATIDNFHVGGELRNLVSLDSIGTDTAETLTGAVYQTGFDMTVGGRVGQIMTRDGMIGNVDVTNKTGASGLTLLQEEVEGYGANRNLGTFSTGYLYQAGFRSFDNNTFDTAQYLGTINTADQLNAIELTGNIYAASGGTNPPLDYWDYYGVSLLAGQTITIQLEEILDRYGTGTGLTTPGYYLNVGVFDPDGRQIASDYSDMDPTQVQYKPFQITADRPGVYRIVVATNGDSDFNGGAAEFGTTNVGWVPYQLHISGAGNLGMGGLDVTNDLYDGRYYGTSMRVRQGDLGAIRVGRTYASTTQAFTDPDSLAILNPNPTVPAPVVPVEDYLTGTTIEVSDGNLRSIDALSVGREFLAISFTTSYGVTLDVPHGSVGLLSARGATEATGTQLDQSGDALAINTRSYEYGSLGYQVGNTVSPITAREVAIGGTYQVVHSNNMLQANLWANRGIGLIRAAKMNSATPGSFIVNADNLGRDGVIDLIDVTGNLGTVGAGGPPILTGPGGNVRYMRVGGTVYRDAFYGGGAPEQTDFEPGEPVTINDDSGARIQFSPGPLTVNQAANPSLQLITYGIRGSGGSAVVRVTSTDSLTIRGIATAQSAGAEVGQVIVNGAGTALATDPNGRPVLPAGAVPLYVNFTGTAKVDVLDVTGSNFTSISNGTGGEIVNVTAASIARLEAGDIGVTRSTSGAAVNPLGVRSNAFPFNQQHTGVVVSGGVAYAKATRSIGNLIVTGPIGQVVADSDNVRIKNRFDGIVGPIYSGDQIFDVTIGQGIAPSGNGNLSHAGIYAVGNIGYVRGRNADIRGNIVSQNRIQNINLTGNGSIINANIQVVGALDQSREIYSLPYTFPGGGGTVNNPVYTIGDITVQGVKPSRYNPTPMNGGIIGTRVQGFNIGTTRVVNGFGLINSLYTIQGPGRIKGFYIDGYGIRDTQIEAGASIGAIVATGKGNRVKSTDFSSSVRLSENDTPTTTYFDPWFRTTPNRLTDLHTYLGTTKATPSIPGITNTGMIAGIRVAASRDLGLVKAYRVTSSDRLVDPIPAVPGQPAVKPTPIISNFDVANTIKEFTVANDVIDTRITTGGGNKFTVGGLVRRLNMTVAGIFSNIQIRREFEKTSLIQGVGPDGELQSITVNGLFNGTMSATRNIGRYSVRKFGATGRILENGVQIAP